MAEYRIGDVVDLSDGDYTIEGVLGGCVRLRRNHDGQSQVLHVTALPRIMLSPPRFALGTNDPRSLDGLSTAERSKVETRARHIEEVLRGDEAGNLSAPTQEKRIQLKVAELAKVGEVTSVRTFSRWVAQYQEAGPAGLVDRRRHQPSAILGRLDDRVRDALTVVVARMANRSTVTKAKLISDTKAEIIRANPGDPVPIPSDRTLTRNLDILMRGKYTTGLAANRQSAANAPKRVFRGRSAIGPGNEVQVDSSPWDVLCLDANGELARAKLSIMLDKATQSIIGTSTNFRGTKGVDLAFMLAQCLTPRPARPEGDLFPGEPELRRMPWAQGLTAEEVEHFDLTRPFIKPQRIMIDNGRDYRSSVFASACQQFGIDITRSATRTPTDKANVERAFATIKTQFVQHLPGYVSGSVAGRGRSPESDDLLDIYTLAELFDRWVSVVWQNMRHDGLRDPVHVRVVHTPNSMYMAMFDMTGFVPIPLTEADYIALLPVALRTIQQDGIQVDYRRYDSDQLNPYRLQPDPATGSRRWGVHYNPHNPGAVWVRHPETGLWIGCPWMNKSAFAKPFSKSVRRIAREITRAHGGMSSREATQATVELIANTRRAQEEHAREADRQETNLELAESSGQQFPIHTAPADPSEAEEAEVGSLEFGLFDPAKGFQ